MAKHIWHNGRWVPAAEYHAARDRSLRSDHPAPLLIRDIEPYRSMATGERITSRSQHRQHLREHGLVEVGNEQTAPKPAFESQGVEHDIKESIEQIEQGHRPAPVETDLDVTRIYPQD